MPESKSEETEFEPLDTSDVDRWVGMPLGGPQPREPFSTNDIRRFVQGMDNPNRAHFDVDYAAAGPFGRIVAPQSYFGGGSGTGALAAIQGKIPGSHMLFGGDEQWFYGPRIYPGDKLTLDYMFFDYRVTNTAFAGPTMFERGDTTYVNQNGEFIAKQRSTAIRYLPANAAKLNSFGGQEKDPEWTDEELEDVYQRRLVWIRSFPGHNKRLWSDVEVGEPMTERVLGPHTIQSFASEALTSPGSLGSNVISPPFPSSTGDAGWLPEMNQNVEHAEDPTIGNLGPSRGHLAPRYARVIGMPRGYGYGASMCVWCVDYLANWAGDHGFVLHHNTQYRNPALTGNVTHMTGEVKEKWVDEQFSRHVVQLTYEMKTHEGTLMARGTAEVVLPES
jgi:acyl dehydratase